MGQQLRRGRRAAGDEVEHWHREPPGWSGTFCRPLPNATSPGRTMGFAIRMFLIDGIL
jgi:hypothetical protein